MRAIPSLLQSNALNVFLLAGTSTDDLKRRRLEPLLASAHVVPVNLAALLPVRVWAWGL